MSIGNSNSDFGEPRASGESPGLRDERFLMLYNAAYQRIYAYVFSLLADRSDACDAMQETSLVLLRRFGDFQPDASAGLSESESFVRWGCGIALNQVRRLRRERASAIPFSEQTLDRIAAARERHSDILESRRRFLPDCLKKLPEADRDLAMRCFCRTTSIKAIAEQANRPVNTLYKAINRIRQRLKQCIDLAVRQEDRS